MSKTNDMDDHNSPCNRDALLLPSTKLRPTFADGSFIAFGKSHDELVSIGLQRCFFDLSLRSSWETICDVPTDCVIERVGS
jgi:hypothetical protein